MSVLTEIAVSTVTSRDQLQLSITASASNIASEERTPRMSPFPPHHERLFRGTCGKAASVLSRARPQRRSSLPPEPSLGRRWAATWHRFSAEPRRARSVTDTGVVRRSLVYPGVLLFQYLPVGNAHNR